MNIETKLLKFFKDNEFVASTQDYEHFFLLMVNYRDILKKTRPSSLAIYGHGQEMYDKIVVAVLSVYPQAEVTSAIPNNSVIFKIGNKQINN